MTLTFSELQQHIIRIVKDCAGGNELDLRKLDVTAADARHGDVATNAALVFAKELGLPPRTLADEVCAELRQVAGVARAEVAGPGFINITFDEVVVVEGALQAATLRPRNFEGQVVVTEYSDPNPFKVLHVGHLYTSVVGDAISNLIRLAGGEVHAVNFGGDVGLHVAKTMWAIVHELGGEYPEKLADIPQSKRSDWMAKCYVHGTQVYEEDESARQEIMALNKEIYRIQADQDHETALAVIYWTCRAYSYDYFKEFYARIGSHFERYYPESETAELGASTVKKQLKRGVYSESKGAVVFKGEPYGLHTRVFITSQGLPSYEAKDVGLMMAKQRDYHFDSSIVITGNDIIEYMKVVLKSIEQFEPELARRTRHITHGNVKLAGGVKMSSRKGNFLRAVDVLDMVAEARTGETAGPVDERVVLGAVKYSFLKQRIGADISFVPEESVNLEGNSGPYLQYAHARAHSILAKVPGEARRSEPRSLEPQERALARSIGRYPEVLQQATDELMPHFICTYLYELTQSFNRFYESNRVMGDARQTERRLLVEAYANVLRDGLGVLGISAPDKL